MNDSRTQALDHQLDAVLGEALGLGPPDDLAARIAALVARARRAPAAVRVPRRSGLFAATLLLGGTLAVAAVWLAQRPDRNAPAAAPPPGAAEEQPQDPATQEPRGRLDEATAARVAALIKQLELPAKRKESLFLLGEIGPDAAPLLDAALGSPAAAATPDLVDALRLARHRLALGLTARAFDLPPEPVTLFADYSENHVELVDRRGRTIWRFDDLFGAWDAEFTPTGTALIAAFSISRVQELDPSGAVVWSYDDLKNPYAASRLPNGNTLIADTFASRVIEVNPAKQIVWTYDRGVRPFDAERLPSGNTLIADAQGNRVLEVTPAGEITWEVPGMRNVHDADRLADGNTLITLRGLGKVIEVDRDGNVVWEVGNLSAPSDADRLPNGNTLVAENTQIREFDRDGAVVWRKKTTWAVEVNRY